MLIIPTRILVCILFAPPSLLLFTILIVFYTCIIIDKPDFLPPPRTIVHTSRAKKSKSSQDTIVPPEVTDESQTPHGKYYSAILANCTQFKVKLIEYVTSKFQAQAMHSTRQHHFSLILDSPSIQTVSTIRNGTLHNSQSNQHGEADYAIWHHYIQTPSNNVLIVSSDTDTWVYGLVVYESGQLSGMQVYVQRGYTDSFIHINKATTLIRNHPILSKISYPVLSLYILTGCDYVSSFYRCTKTKFLETLLDNIGFICPVSKNGNG